MYKKIYKKSTQQFISWLLVFVMSLGIGFLPVYAVEAAGNDVTGLLQDVNATVMQDGQEIPEGGTLDSAKPVEVEVSFRIPVVGDGGDGPFISKGDFAFIELAKGFSVLTGPGEELIYEYQEDGVEKSKTVGTIHLVTTTTGSAIDPGTGGTTTEPAIGPGTTTGSAVEPGTTTGSALDAVTTAEITFDGEADIFDGSEGWSDVVCKFNATLHYAGEPSGEEDKDIVVEILDKEFTVHIPETETTLTGSKSGVRNGQLIDWTVRVKAKKGNGPGDLSGYTFKDDLSGVGEYITDSFRIGIKEDGSDLAATSPSAIYVPEDELLTYTFSEGTTGSGIVIAFQTKIPDDIYYSNGEKTIRNTARVFDGETEEFSETGTVTLKGDWIEKEGAITEFDAANNTGKITWTITANELGATLPNAVITDKLDAKLEWEGATLQVKEGDNWTTPPAITFDTNSIVTDTPPGKGKYNPTTGEYGLGDITTPVKLTIVTKVDATNFNIGHKVQPIKNYATIRWGGRDGIGSGEINVNIGLNPITKTVGTYDVSEHTIPWTVTVKKSDININLRVLDLLVYGSSGSFSAGSIDMTKTVITENPGFTGTTTLPAITVEDIGKLTPQYNQKYKPNTFETVTTSALAVTAYTLYNKEGKAVADLLAVTKDDGGGIDVLGGDQSFTFKTIVTNPGVYAKNGSSKMYNTASLFSANEEINRATAETDYKSNMVSKDMLSVTDAEDPDANKNGSGARADEGYSYTDHSIIFRIHVNANNLKDFTNDITTTDGETIGKVTLTDTLPEGWVFKEIITGKNYLIYKGTPGTGGKVTAGDAIANPSGFLTADFTNSDVPGTLSKAAFTFTTLDQPYVILIKAGPSEDTIKNYFSKNGTYPLQNTASLSAENWKPGAGDWEDVKIMSEILAKDLSAAEDGILTWNVDYKPNKIGHEGAYIEDTLPVGVDLRTDATGRLILGEGNITAIELTLNADGSYDTGNPVDLRLDENIFYDNAARVLKFAIPEPAKAYRLTYKTDITGDPGATLTNSVKLSSTTANQGDVKDEYKVEDADASATMKRSGWLEITKQDENKDPLQGVGFTLYAADGTTVFRAGTTNSEGKLALRGLPEGSYVLRETKVPNGYNPIEKAYDVVVGKSNGKFTTSIDGKTGNDSNKITVTNFKIDTVGDLTVRKTLSGNAAESGKEFHFTVTVNAGASSVSGAFDYTGMGGKEDGILTLENGSDTFTLKGGESITIHNLPKGAAYTVTEEDYSADGYSVSAVNASGTISADTIAEVSFINTKEVEPTATPTPTPTVTPTPTPTPTTSPTATPTPEPTEAPEPTEKPEPTDEPDETETPKPSPTPEPTVTPEPTEPGVPIEPMEPTPAPTSTPAPPTEPTGPTGPATPAEPPRYRPEEVPDPNDPSSPDQIVIIDDEEVPIGSYSKHKKPDDTFVYVDENGVPYGYRPVPKTGDGMPVALWLTILLGSLSAAAALAVLRKKHSGQQ